jgi:hypothetical protein
MNERIKELARKAGFELNPAHFDHEKFAELIVLECAGVELYWLSEQDCKAVAEKIKQHFGILDQNA